MNLSNHMLGRGGAGLITCDSADFDGTNDYMTRGAGLTGAADSKLGTFSIWLRLDSSDGVFMRIIQSTTLVGGTVLRALRLGRTTGNKFQVQAVNAAGTEILDVSTVSTFTAGAAWISLLGSFDLSDAGKRHLYANDASDLAVTTYTDDTIDYTAGDYSVGARPDGGNKFNGCIAEVWYAPGVYIDLSVTANRRKFISATGKPVFLGSTGEIPTGTAPLVYQHIADGEAVANFATNRGSGGDFAITGTLATGSTSPSD